MVESLTIGWVADYTIKEHRGGGQQTNHEMVLAGIKRGHTIDYIMPTTYNQKNINKYDLLIINRITTFNQNIKELMIRSPHVRYEHDYDSVWSDPFCKKLYEKSLLNIFLSPLHFQTFNTYYIKKYGKNIERVYLQPSPVLGFKKLCDTPTKNTVMWAGDMHYLKGIDNVVAYAQNRTDLKFDFYVLGMSDTVYINKIRRLNNTNIYSELKNKKDMNDAYSRHEYFIHLPIWKEPFGRTVLEAYLSGCNLIVNKNIGATSYGWNFNNYESIVNMNDKATDNFWKNIENTILKK